MKKTRLFIYKDMCKIYNFFYLDFFLIANIWKYLDSPSVKFEKFRVKTYQVVSEKT